MNTEQSKLRTGKRPAQTVVRSMPAGKILCAEGSEGRELYIVQEGLLGVYRRGDEGAEVKLAEVGETGIIGEMSLLDGQPRSATVKAVKDSKVLVVNQAVFKSNMAKAPVWLASIVKIVVSRLRDTNKRVDRPVLMNRELGLVSLIREILPVYGENRAEGYALPYRTIMIEAYLVCGLKKGTIKAILNTLEKRGVIELRSTEEVLKDVLFPEMETFTLYYEYLKLKAAGKTFPELVLKERDMDLLSNIDYVAQKSGFSGEDGTKLKKGTLLEDFSEKEKQRIDKQLTLLKRKGFVNILPENGEDHIVFSKEMISRVKKIREKMPSFEKEIDAL